MTKYYTIILSTLILLSCKPKLSERDKQMIANLKKDIEFKIDVCKFNEIIHKSYLYNPNKVKHTLKYYLFQNNLMKYFEMLKIDSLQHKAIDSLNTKITIWNKFIDTANYFKSHKIELNINPLNHIETRDSIDLFILQNSFLFKMIELQNYAYSGMNIDKVIYNSFEILNIKNQYNLNDTIAAFILPYDSENLYQYKIKIYYKNKLEFETLQNNFSFNYKPFKKGKYTIFIDGEFYYDRGMNYNIEEDFQIGEFEVK